MVVEEFVLDGLDEVIVTSALKLFLREMEPPLIPYELYNVFLEAGQQAEEGISILIKENEAITIFEAEESGRHQFPSIKIALSLLPEVRARALELLCKHLALIARHSDVNLVRKVIFFSSSILKNLNP